MQEAVSDPIITLNLGVLDAATLERAARGEAVGSSLASGTVVAIGNFDGCHLGHQKVLSLAKQKADALGVGLSVVTFDPHPRAILRPAEPYQPLMLLSQKKEALHTLGVTQVCVVSFDDRVALLSANDFIAALRTLLAPSAVFVGDNFSFGHQRGGNAEFLKSSMPDTTVVPAVHREGGHLCSTTAIKQSLANGDIASANAMLGRPFATQGLVVIGAQRGRTLGFPTANLAVGKTFLPAPGVYVAMATVPDKPHPLRAVINWGRRPTFDGASLQLEVHILDYSGDLYGKTLTVHWLGRLRDEQKFASVDALVVQIQQDVAQARTWSREDYGRLRDRIINPSAPPARE